VADESDFFASDFDVQAGTMPSAAIRTVRGMVKFIFSPAVASEDLA